MEDFVVANHGTIYTLLAVTEAAKAWVDENLPDDAQTFGGAVVVEHRYIDDIVNGINADGLAVRLTY